MGTDIYIFSESYMIDGWICDQSPSFSDGFFWEGRNSYLFGVLAGVRASTNTHFEVKGLPKDVSPEILNFYEKNKKERFFHKPSYITKTELQDWLKTDWRLNLGLLNDYVSRWIDLVEDGENDKAVENMESFLNDPRMDEDFQNAYNVLKSWDDRLIRDGFYSDKRLVFWFDS